MRYRSAKEFPTILAFAWLCGFIHLEVKIINMISVISRNERNLLLKSWTSEANISVKSQPILKKLYEVSCDELDFLVDFTSSYDEIIGSRMMGGGFGGCTINLIEENLVNDFIKSVSKAYLKKFNIKLNAFQINIDDGVTVKKN